MSAGDGEGAWGDGRGQQSELREAEGAGGAKRKLSRGGWR